MKVSAIVNAMNQYKVAKAQVQKEQSALEAYRLRQTIVGDSDEFVKQKEYDLELAKADLRNLLKSDIEKIPIGIGDYI